MSTHSTPTDTQDFVICGRFGSTHGVRGAIKVFSETDPAEALLDYQPWWVQTNEGWQELTYTDPKVAAKYLLVTPKGCTDCDMARRYTNQHIAIKRDQFPDPEDGTYYWSDIIGCQVINHDQTLLGSVVDIYDQSGTDIFVIEDSNKNRTQIPHLEQYIKQIDIPNQTIAAHWELI